TRLGEGALLSKLSPRLVKSDNRILEWIGGTRLEAADRNTAESELRLFPKQKQIRAADVSFEHRDATSRVFRHSEVGFQRPLGCGHDAVNVPPTIKVGVEALIHVQGQLASLFTKDLGFRVVR